MSEPTPLPPDMEAQLQTLPANVPGLSTTDVRTLLGLLTEDEFGRAVGVVGPTIAIWRNKGEGPPFYRFRRNIFYRTADITQWIIENTWDPRTGERLMPVPEPLPKLGAAERGRRAAEEHDRIDKLNSGELRPDGTRAPRSSPRQEEPRGAIGDHVPSVG